MTTSCKFKYCDSNLGNHKLKHPWNTLIENLLLMSAKMNDSTVQYDGMLI